MATDTPTTIFGIVQNGVVVPQSNAALREGTHVEIVIESSGVPPELLSEIAMWDKASDESWAMIDQWEDRHRVSSRVGEVSENEKQAIFNEVDKLMGRII